MCQLGCGADRLVRGVVLEVAAVPTEAPQILTDAAVVATSSSLQVVQLT